MPDTAAFVTVARCACGHVVMPICTLQWGAVPRDQPYASGQEPEWLRLPDGRIVPPFRIWRGRWNCGDPALHDVLVKDPTLLGGPITCTACGAVYEGVATEIAGGRFRGARLYREGELPGEAEVFERLADGTLKPHPEWLDAALDAYDDHTL